MIYSYINTRENWKNSKLCENTPPCGRRVSTQFLVFPISTRVDITVYQHGKCFIFLKYKFSNNLNFDKMWKYIGEHLLRLHFYCRSNWSVPRILIQYISYVDECSSWKLINFPCLLHSCLWLVSLFSKWYLIG